MRQLILSLFSILICACSSDNNSPKIEAKSETFVLVHGSTGGGWDWKTIAQKLEAKGYKAYRPTLTGLGERMHLASESVTLKTHIDDIVNTIIFEDLQDVVLTGHSYGGAVITGVINEIPERIKHVIFLDAFVLDDGMTAKDAWVNWPTEDAIIDGLVNFSWLKPEDGFPKDVPHPYNTLTQPVSYDNPKAKMLNVSYVAFIPKGMTQQTRAEDPSWIRAQDRGWTIRTFPGDHTVYRDEPDAFTKMLIEALKDTNSK